MAEKLDSFEKQRQQWISDISHELGTPLAVLRGEIEAIQDGVRKFKTERLVSLHAEVMHISRIVDDLKLINRAEAGDLSLSKVETDPIKLLRETLEQFKERLSKSEINFFSAKQLLYELMLLNKTMALMKHFQLDPKTKSHPILTHNMPI